MFLLGFLNSLRGQSLILSEVPFLNQEGTQYRNAFAGGIRAPQLSKIDLNQDGLEDLLIFDRAGDVYSSFIAQDSNSIDYHYDPVWTEMFPKSRIWIEMVDFNDDGIKDLFGFPISPRNEQVPGVEIYEGQVIDGKMEFEKVLFPEERDDYLHFPLPNGSRSQIFVSTIDVPAITDIDQDGDVDILVFGQGGSTVDFYKNLSMENEESLSSLNFIKEDACFGRFREDDFNQDVTVSFDGKGCGNSRFAPNDIETRHSGSTLEIFDANGDGLFDLLLGDASYSGINFLLNGGSKSEAWMTSSELGYPSSAPVDIQLFLTPHVLDIDNDGIAEFIAVSNDRFISQTKDNFWYYENLDSVSMNPVLSTKEFLYHTMIDHGEQAAPTFCDYNADGLLDIIIGTSGRYILTSEKEPALILYENVGTPTAPRFQVKDSDYLNFNQFKNTSSFFAPAFGDLDGDGDDDLIVGDNRGFLYYAENNGGEGNPYDFSSPIYEYEEIRVSGFLRPHIFDLNEDGFGDIIAGERNFNSSDEFPIGSINYFQNIGSIGAPDFEPNINLSPNNATLGGINLKQQNSINNNSSISIWHDQSQFLVFTGSESGDVRLFFQDSDSLLTTEFPEKSSEYGLNFIDVGKESSVSVADIDGDLLLELLVGNFRGGIALYETDISASKVIDNTKEEVLGSEISIFPNPAANTITIQSEKEVEHAEIWDIQGRMRIHVRDIELDISTLESGLYILRLFTGEGVAIKKLIKS